MAVVGSCLAGQVDWSSSAFSIHQRSDGTPLDGSFAFELGGFADGFVPSSDNTDQWAAHWQAAQRAFYNPTTQIFAGSFVMETNAAPFDTSGQGYIWGLSLDHPGEWFLITSPVWKWPAVGGANPPVAWTVQNSVSTVVGEIDRDGDPYFLRTGAVSVSNPIPWVTPTAWRGSHFSLAQIAAGTADWLADPDGDGLTNLDEMGAGTDPLVPDHRSIYTVSASAGNALQVTVDKVPNHVLDYVVEMSDDLVTWRNAMADLEVITESANRLVVRDRLPLSTSYRRFFRTTVVLSE